MQRNSDFEVHSVFSSLMAAIELPVIDLQEYIATGSQALCDQVADCLRKYGVLCVRDEVV